MIQYTTKSSAFRLSKFRIQKLVKKLEQQEMKIFGSAKLFRIFDFSVKQAEKTKKIFKRQKEAAPANEYIDLAKMYSTPQSGQFVNGVLDNLLKELSNEGLIRKQERGLKS